MKLTEVFTALSDETRLRIIKLFLSCGKALCVCEIVDVLKLPQYQVSKHLAVLKHTGLIEKERSGTWIYYTLTKEKSPFLRSLFRVLKDNLSEQTFENDETNLQSRLNFRIDDKCVVGFVKKKSPTHRRR